MKKNFLTVFWNASPKEILYKDVEGIPYALSKYCGWNTTYAYGCADNPIEDKDYEKYVKLEPIPVFRWIKNKNSKLARKISAVQYIFHNASKYDVLQLYHYNYFNRFLCKLAKVVNPEIVTYIKLDMGRGVFSRERKKKERWIVEKLLGTPSIFTVETLKYVEELNSLSRYKGRVKYLPNGFFDDLATTKDVNKENIILTVGRLGTYQKNTELLVDAFAKIDNDSIEKWKLYLVGSLTKDFEYWLDRKLKQNPILKDRIVITGHIGDKAKLYNIYARSKIFVLPSRMESWGLVLTEALHFKNYVVVTDCCDAYFDFLIDRGNLIGSIVPNENMKELTSELEIILADEEKYDNLAKQGSLFINENFNWKIIAKNLESYFVKEG